jgi:hypothetical protein
VNRNRVAIAALVALAPALGLSGCARPEPVVVTVPFVGCPADGQLGPIAAPIGQPRTVSHRPFDDEIAFYQGENAVGAFGPRGWDCQVAYGSGGSHLLITPAPFNPPKASWSKVSGPAVELGTDDGGTSGRFGVAIIGSRLFPRITAPFIQRVVDEGVETAKDLSLPPFPADSISYLDSLAAEFTTPAHMAGIGTQWELDSTGGPIHGIAALDTTGDWALRAFVWRLGPGHSGRDSLIRALNLQCMRKPDGC